MDAGRAGELLDAEEARVTALLADVDRMGEGERGISQERGDPADLSAPLTAEEEDDAVAASLRERLAALRRARQRLEDGTFGRSVRSGGPIDDERLEADPAAELTAEEARAGA